MSFQPGLSLLRGSGKHDETIVLLQFNSALGYKEAFGTPAELLLTELLSGIYHSNFQRCIDIMRSPQENMLT